MKEGIVNHNDHHLPYSLLRVFLALILFFAFLLPSISAVEISMDSEFAKGETLLAVFSGNFVDQITEDNVHFYRNNVEIPMTSGVVKINNDFYVYAVLNNKTAGNYSIRIKDVRYYQATQVISAEIRSNFTISNETAEFSVNPGVVKTGNDFTVELQNLQDNQITVDITNPESINSVSTIGLNTGQKKIISFTLDSLAPRGLTTIMFSSGNTSYSMPVYLDTANAPPENGTNGTGGTGTTENFEMEFQPEKVSVSLATNSGAKKILYLKNTGTSTIKDISFTIPSVLEPYVSISPDEINTLEPDEIIEIELDLSSGAEETTVEGDIVAVADNASAQFTLTLDFAENYVAPGPVEGVNPEIASLCEADLNGVICGETEECSGDIVRSRNGDCCVPPLVCREPKRSSAKTLIGWGLLLIVLLIVIWFFRRKYRRVSPRRPF